MVTSVTSLLTQDFPWSVFEYPLWKTRILTVHTACVLWGDWKSVRGWSAHLKATSCLLILLHRKTETTLMSFWSWRERGKSEKRVLKVSTKSDSRGNQRQLIAQIMTAGRCVCVCVWGGRQLASLRLKWNKRASGSNVLLRLCERLPDFFFLSSVQVHENTHACDGRCSQWFYVEGQVMCQRVSIRLQDQRSRLQVN